MPKKTTSAHSSMQRNKPKQKSFELVRPVSATVDELESSDAVENVGNIEATPAPVSVAANAVEAAPTARAVATPKVKAFKAAPEAPSSTVDSGDKEEENGDVVVAELPKGSAAARMAARRQASQKVSYRATSTLITSEHYAYVRKDLIFIAILAIVMFAALIILHFVPGIGS